MMLKIEDDIVRRNVEIFKIILKRSTQKGSQDISHIYRAYVHRERGEIRFSEMNDHSLHEKEWQVIVFRFTLPTGSQGCFECNIEDLDQRAFSWQSWQPQALAVLKETMKTMQLISRFLPKLSGLTQVLHEFSQVNLDTFLDRLSSKDIIHEAWHQFTRIECEKELLKQREGTFLFRKDEYASILEEQLSKALDEEIKCVTLSYIDTKSKISDLTLVKKKEGWLFYNDDPNLQSPVYPSVLSLLDSMKGVLKSPFLHESSISSNLIL